MGTIQRSLEFIKGIMSLEAISFREGDILVDQSDQEIVKIVEIHQDYHSRRKDYLLEILKTGNGWANIKPGEQFWAEGKDVHWV